MVEAQPNWQVVAEADDGKEAVQKALETKPDVAVIDYSLPLVNGAGRSGRYAPLSRSPKF
jgi:chemotaxis response regulator CheB